MYVTSMTSITKTDSDDTPTHKKPQWKIGGDKGGRVQYGIFIECEELVRYGGGLTTFRPYSILCKVLPPPPSIEVCVC